MKKQLKWKNKQIKMALKQSIEIIEDGSDNLVIDFTEQQQSEKEHRQKEESDKLSEDCQDDLDYLEISQNLKIREMRQMLIKMTRTNATFPPILQFIEIDNLGARINYDANLHQCLKKMQSSIGEIEQIELIKDEEIILNHLYAIEHSINESQENKVILIKSCQSTIFYLFEKTQRIKQKNSKNFQNIIQNLKLIYYETKEYLENQKQQSECRDDEDESDKSEPSIQKEQITFQNQLRQEEQQEEKKTFEKMRDFTIKILLQKMNQLQIIMPELMLYLRLIYKTRDKGRIILLVPVKIIVDICNLPEIKPFAQELKFPLFSQFVPKSTRCALRNKYPELSYKTLDTVIDEMITLIQSKWDQYQPDIEKVFTDNNFKEFLQSMWKLCGKQISTALQQNTDLKIRDNQQIKSNFVSIGAKLFQMKKRMESSKLKGISQNLDFIGEESGKSEQFTYENTHTTFLKFFLWKLAKGNIPYPLMLKLLHFSNLTIMVMNRKQYLKEIVQTKLFIQFIKEMYGYEIEALNPMERVESVFFTNRFQIMYVITKNWSQIILNQLELIYNARFQYQEVIKSAVDTKQFRYNIQQLKLTNEQLEIRIQIKELIFKLYEFALNIAK